MSKLRTIIAAFAAGFVFLSTGMAWGSTYTDEDGYVWTYAAGETSVTVTKVEPCEYDLVIPAEIDSKPVTSFSATMFQGNTKISSVEIPDSITSIGDNAFNGCSQLQQVGFGAGIVSIGNNAFKNCVLLLKAELPSATTSLGTGCFSGCVKLNTAKLPGVTSIPGAANDKQPGWSSFDGYGAFFNCEKLRTLQLGEGLTYIGNGAFYNCNELYDVTIPDAVTSIGNWAFAECDKLNTVAFGANLHQIGCDAFLNDVKLISISFNGDKLRILWDEAFRNCQGLDGVVLPDGLLTIKSWCFRNCKAMKAIVIPDSVVTNEVGTFANCSALLTAKVGNGLTYIAGAEDDKVPGWSSFDSYGMFYGCASLTNVEISANATRIECGAFYGCSALPEVTIPGKVREVKGYAFAECAMLKKVTVGDSVRLIGNNAFYNDVQLETLRLGAKVQTIQAEAFRNCTALKSFEFPETLMTIGNWAFRNCDTLGVVALPDSLGSVGVGVFARCDGLTDVLIGESLEEVVGAEDDKQPGWSSFDGYGMFCDCTSLTNVHFGSSVATIGCGAFYGCSTLREIDVPSCVTSIKPYAFNACSALQRVRLADEGVTSIGQYAFKGDANLETIVLGNRLQSIGSYAFQSCAKLNNVVLPETLQTLGAWCFNACSALLRIEIPDSVINLNSGAFANCPALTTVKIGTGVLTVSGADDDKQPGWSSFDGYGAFSGCTALKTLDLGSVATIACGAFYGCSALETVTIPDTVTKIAPYAFANCPSLRAVTVGTKLATLGNNAFAKDSALHYVEFKGETAPSSVGANVYADTNGRMTTYVASGSTGWTALYQPGLPETWQGRPIAYAPPPEGADNPYDFYPYVPTARVSGRNYSWPSPLMLTKTRYLHGSTIPATVAEFKQGDTVYLNYAFDEYWRGDTFENLTNAFVLSGAKTAQEDKVSAATTLDYSYRWGTNVTLNILKDLAPGDYTLTMNLNAGRNLAETDYGNNTTSLTFRVIAAQTFTVTFAAHGGVPAPEARIRYEGTEVGELPTVTRAGHVFDGWYTAETGGSKVDATTRVTADVTYHAQWKKLPNIIFWKPTDMTWTEPLFVASSASATEMQSVFEEGDAVYFYYACYEADGRSVSKSFVNRIKVAGDNEAELAFQQNVPGISSGTCRGIFGQKVSELQNLKPGIYTLTCTLDADGDVDESDKTDNVKSITFKVVPAGTPLPPSPTVPKLVPGVTDAVPEKGATYSGFISDGAGRLVGVFTLVAGKPKNGVSALKATITDLATGKKKTVKASLDVATGLADGPLTGLQIGANGVLGTVAGLGSFEGGVDAVKAKDATAIAVLNSFNKRGCALAFRSTPVSGAGAAFAYGNLGLSVTFGTKGKAKVVGVLPDGAKVSVSSQLVLGNGLGCLPIAYAKKTGSFGLVLWIDLQKMVVTTISGITSLVSAGKTPYEATLGYIDIGGISGYLKEGTVFSAQFDVLPQQFKAVTLATSKAGVSILPNGVPVDGRAAKWILPAAGKVALNKAKDDLDSSKFKDNPAALKLSYTLKTSLFKGSFSLYQDVNGKPKKVAATVNGVVVNGAGYGSAVIKKVGSVPVVIDVVK